MRRVDHAGVGAVNHLHLLQAGLDSIDLGQIVLDLADAFLQVPQVDGALLDGALALLDVGAGGADRLLGEFVDQGKLEPRVGRDLLDLVLAVDVGLEYEITVERHRHRVAIAVQDLDVVAPRPLGPVASAVLRLDFEADQATAQVAAHMPLDRLRARPAVGRVRHQPEDIADELDDGGLAGAAPADDAVQPVAELEAGAVQEPALDL